MGVVLKSIEVPLQPGLRLLGTTSSGEGANKSGTAFGLFLFTKFITKTASYRCLAAGGIGTLRLPEGVNIGDKREVASEAIVNGGGGGFRYIEDDTDGTGDEGAEGRGEAVFDGGGGAARRTW